MDQIYRNRLEQFRQLRNEIRHSEQYLIVGIDIAKERHHAFFGTATGKTLLRRLVFSNDHEGFRKLLDQAEALGVRHGLKKVVYGMEPTANYHKPLGEYLISLGRIVVLVSGVTVKRNRESLDGRWDKHDCLCNTFFSSFDDETNSYGGSGKYEDRKHNLNKIFVHGLTSLYVLIYHTNPNGPCSLILDLSLLFPYFPSI